MFDQFKPFVRDGERYIVVEGGEPTFVVMSFRDYRELAGRGNPKPRGGEPLASRPVWERANAELAIEPSAPPLDPSTVRLEDLPI